MKKDGRVCLNSIKWSLTHSSLHVTYDSIATFEQGSECIGIQTRFTKGLMPSRVIPGSRVSSTDHITNADHSLRSSDAFDSMRLLSIGGHLASMMLRAEIPKDLGRCWKRASNWVLCGQAFEQTCTFGMCNCPRTVKRRALFACLVG